MTQKTERNWYRTRRVFLHTYSNGPWLCEYCGELILQLGRSRMDGNIHHKDKDIINDTAENLCVMHTVCHQHHHEVSERTRMMWVRGILMSHTHTQEERQRISVRMRGEGNLAKKEVTRNAMREAWIRRKAKWPNGQPPGRTYRNRYGRMDSSEKEEQ